MVEQLANSYPDRLAVVTMHVNGDGYDTAWGQNRLDGFYNQGSAVPTFMVDGAVNCQPGDYQFCVEQELAVSTDVTIELSGTEVTAGTWDVTARVCLEAGGSRPVRVITASTLDNHPALPSYSTNLLMQDAFEANVTLPGGGCQDVTTRITFDALCIANPNDIAVVAWAEQPAASGPTTVYQAGIMHWPFPAGSRLATIEVTPTEIDLGVGESAQLTATGKDQFGEEIELTDPTWSLGGGNGAGSLDPTHGTTTTFTATAPGTRQILCRDGDVTGGAIAVISEAPVLTAITIDPGSVEVDVEGQVSFTAAGVDQYGDTFPLSDPSWTVSGTGDGSFDPATGTTTTFTASSPGSCIVSCTQDDVTGTAAVEVVGEAPRVDVITVSPASAQLRLGASVGFSATAVDQYGRTIALGDPAWRVEGSAAGSFDPASGSATTSFTATGEGSGQVICSDSGVDGAATVTIAPPGLPAPRKATKRVAP